MNSFPRSSGILLPLFSLPSPSGIGTLGKAAHNFVKFLSCSGQTFWQLLPLGPTSFGDSPYQSFSSFAGNPYFIDLDLLIEDGLLTDDEVKSFDWGSDPRYVDYKKIYDSRFELLNIAYKRGNDALIAKVDDFTSLNASWLPDYALFMALKQHFDMKPWYDWQDSEIRLYKPEAIIKYRESLKENIQFYIFLQFLFHRQWEALRKYCSEIGIKLIGDMPIYVAMDSGRCFGQIRNSLC